jgi:hypothetical protein
MDAMAGFSATNLAWESSAAGVAEPGAVLKASNCWRDAAPSRVTVSGKMREAAWEGLSGEMTAIKGTSQLAVRWGSVA